MSAKTTLLRKQSRRYSDLRNRNGSYAPHIDTVVIEQNELDLGNTNIGNNALSVPVVVEQPIVPVLEAKVVSAEKTRFSILLFFVSLLSISLGIVGIGINAWFSFHRGINEIDQYFMSGIGALIDAIGLLMPGLISLNWKGKNYGKAGIAFCLYVPFLAFAVYNSLGFASMNLTEVTTARAERITPAVSDASRKLDTLTASRAVECVKRGDRCRQLEKEERDAMEALREARERVSATADPQVMSAAKLVSWLSVGRYNPSADDFAMLRLLFLTLLPQLGGLVLMLSARS